MEHAVVFQPMGLRARTDEKTNLLKLAERSGLEIESFCGGMGLCGACRVKVNGPTLPADDQERDLLGPDAGNGYRLACKTLVKGSVVVWTPESSRRHKQEILTSGFKPEQDFDPDVKCFEAHVPAAKLISMKADRERMLQELDRVAGPELHGIPYTPLDTLRGLDEKLAKDNGRLSVTVSSDGCVVDIASGWEKDCLGLAVDLGTTTIVVYLMDLRVGRTLSIAADMNPQVSKGEDVIRRISLCRDDPEQLKELSEIVRLCIDRLAAEACTKARTGPDRILDCVIVGNTAMHHIVLGLNPGSLSRAPYTPVMSDAIGVPAREIGLGLPPEARVTMLPVKAGFVGADTVAVALALGAGRVNEPTLMVDLGTNGEMILATKEEVLCCSTAAGPAFEGAHIRWGMRGAAGAIDRAGVSQGDLAPKLRVIGGGRPLGICGSGLVSVVSQLIKAGVVKNSGGFDDACIGPHLRSGSDGLEYILARAENTGVGRDITISHRDLAELQLAKAAIHAGVSLLMKELGVTRIHKVLLAGAFGNYLDPSDACSINMFPGVDPSHVRGVGNAAGVGACMALISRKLREKARSLARSMRYLELAGHPDFNDAFVDGMTFRP
jgi:uncharacterized 2Fe-2S/4Fe-4S cluster protein (DUF4445 family)